MLYDRHPHCIYLSRYTLAGIGTCPGHARVANTQIQSTVDNCQKLGGSIIGDYSRSETLVGCHLDVCIINESKY